MRFGQDWGANSRVWFEMESGNGVVINNNADYVDIVGADYNIGNYNPILLRSGSTAEGVYIDDGNVSIGAVTAEHKFGVYGGTSYFSTGSQGVFLSTVFGSGTAGKNLFMVDTEPPLTGSSSGFLGSYNTGFGAASLSALTTGLDNSAFGYGSLYSNTTGEQNTAVGNQCLTFATTGSYNTAIGSTAGYQLTSGSNNLFCGFGAGRYYGVSSVLTTANNCIHLGYGARSDVDSVTNQIVVGYQATGSGSDSATWGNDSIADHYMHGTVHLKSGTAPSASVADQCLLFSVDLSAGNATLGIRTETATNTSRVDRESNRTIPFVINGETVWLLGTTIDPDGV